MHRQAKQLASPPPSYQTLKEQYVDSLSQSELRSIVLKYMESNLINLFSGDTDLPTPSKVLMNVLKACPHPQVFINVAKSDGFVKFADIEFIEDLLYKSGPEELINIFGTQFGDVVISQHDDLILKCVQYLHNNGLACKIVSNELCTDKLFQYFINKPPYGFYAGLYQSYLSNKNCPEFALEHIINTISNDTSKQSIPKNIISMLINHRNLTPLLALRLKVLMS